MTGLAFAGAFGVLAHLAGPAQKTEQLAALCKEEPPEVAQGDGFGVEAGVSLKAPAEIWASPGPQTVSLSSSPEKTNHAEHPVQDTTKRGSCF